jgi:hypothetical protein
VAIGTSAAHISAVVGRKRTMVAVDFILDSNNAKANFDKLYETSFEESRTDISMDIEWSRLDDKKSCYISVETAGDYHDRSDWSRQFEWLYHMTVKFHNFFRPRVKNMK